MTKIDTDRDGSVRAPRAAAAPDGLPTADEVQPSCDWGSCDGEVVAVRWNDSGEGITAWLGVCRAHSVDAIEAGALLVPLYALPALRLVEP